MLGRPFILALTPGNIADTTAASGRLARLSGACDLSADKGYDANALRDDLRRRGTVPDHPASLLPSPASIKAGSL